MTQNDNGPCPGRNYGEMGVFTFGRKVVFGLKMGLTPINHPKWYFGWWLFGQRQLFSLNNFFWSWPKYGVQQEVNIFFGPEILFFGQIIQFLPYNPNFGQWPVCSPQRGRSFPTLGAIFRLFFLSYSRFRKKNLVDVSKSLPPPHSEGTVCQ